MSQDNKRSSNDKNRITRVVSADEMAKIKALSDQKKSSGATTRSPQAGQPAPKRSAAGSAASTKRSSSAPQQSRQAASATPSGPRTGRTIVRTSKKKSKKKHVWLKRFVLGFLCVFLIAFLVGCGYIYSIIKDTPQIDPQTLYAQLSETTRMYDDQGKEIDTIFFGSNRELVTIDKISDNVINAVIAIEDKSFRSHHGFNFVRIVGAIRDALFSGGQISGTSTITQQLARNIYLKDKQFEHDYKRKIQEAYYALRIEKELSKDEIMQGYLNAIYFGYGCFGVETAAQTYFGKPAKDLTVAEGAALAALPQRPDAYQLIQFIEGGTPAAYPETFLYETSDGVYIANDKSKERREACLALMLEQELITEAEYNQAMNVSLKSMLHPNFETGDANSIYFADYCINEIIQDLIDVKGLEYEDAWNQVYQGGLEIHSTLDSQAQEVIRTEFNDNSNYPWVKPTYDGYGNIINTETGGIALYAFSNFFDESGNFVLYPDDYKMLSDGSLQINYGRNLNIYTTTVSEGTEYSLEFKTMYYYADDWTFYTISGGYVNIPRTYKSINSNNDLIISAEFMNDPEYEGYFVPSSDGILLITPKAYSLNPRTIQPQVAMTIVENSTGHIKAMVGGRNASGRMIYNRATALRQAGSSIKPLAIYSAALQQSMEECKNGVTHTYVDYGIDRQGAKYYGPYLTASSIVMDEKTTVNGEVWPKNANKIYSGLQTMRSAMTKSLNTCAVKLWYQIGASYSMENVKKFGITSMVEEGTHNDMNPAALALGSLTYGVSTVEMASAYTVFPNNGVRYETKSYTKVLDRDGNILLENPHTEHQVLDPGVAWIMTDMLHNVVTSGTGTNAYVPNTFVGGKTGTTQDSKDDWFDGFTMNYSASLWIGSDIAIDLSETSVIATLLWGKIMRQIDAAYLGTRAEMPSNVIRYNGEYYIDGTQKGLITSAAFAKKVTLCKESGLLATPECTDTEVKQYDEYTNDFTPPKYYCHIHNSDPSKYPVSPDGQQYLDDKRAEEERQIQEEEEARKRQEEAEEERKRQEEEERQRQEEEQRQKEAEEERKRQEEEERRRQEEENQPEPEPEPEPPPEPEPEPEG